MSLMSTGCVVMKNNHGNEGNSINMLNNNSLIDNLNKQNLGTKGFYVSRAEINITTKNGTEKILGNIKYKPSGRFLLSLRAKTGIEIARIFITGDTLLVNDRINRKLYHGSSMYIRSKYGIPFSAIPIIFGDYVKGNDKRQDINNCIDGKLVLDENLGEIGINYLIDCKRGKSISANLNDKIRNEKIEIKYSKFIKNSLGFMPEVMQINDLQRETTVIIKLKKIESPWDGDIEFIPGKQYENELLQ